MPSVLDGSSSPHLSPVDGVRVDVLRALAELPRTQRAVLVLRYFEDKPVAEVAEMLGLAQGTVKAYSHRALQQLRGSVHLEEQRS